MLTFEFNGVEGQMTQTETLTSGMVGKEVCFEFSSDWSGLKKTAVFVAGDVCRVVEDLEETAVIPAEVLANSMSRLYVGVYGVSEDDQVVIPTLMARGPAINCGADPAKDGSVTDVIPVWKAIQQQIGQLDSLSTVNKDCLVSAINEVYRILMSLEAMGSEGGKTAYTYAVEGGFVGTEAEFMEKMARPYAPVEKTDDMTLPVGVDTAGGLYYSPGDVALKIYPVGSIYLSVVSTSPAELFGGTWEQISDTFLLAAGSAYEAGTTGGEATHTLTTDEMPKHYHGIIKDFGTAAFDNSNYPSWAIKLLSDSVNNASANPDTGGSGGTGYAGGSAAHNNMPPYLAVYVWKRVA